jgi:hypothetical protein
MTINDVITEVDTLKPNQISDEIKVRWLSVLEGKIIDEIILTHRLSEIVEFNGYTIDDMNTELIVPDTYADLYKYYLYAMIDATNNEAARYANSMSLYSQAWQDYANYYNRNNMPIGEPLKLL